MNARFQQGWADGAAAAKADAPALDADNDHIINRATLAANQAAETDKRMTARSRAVYSIGWCTGYMDIALQKESPQVKMLRERRQAARARFSIVRPEPEG